MPAQTVPYYLRHLFWNTAKSQLNVTTSAPFIAKRLLSTGDLDGLAWGATHLPPASLGARRPLTGNLTEGSRSRTQPRPETQ